MKIKLKAVDLESIASFNKIVMNYLKMLKLSHESKQSKIEKSN